MSPRASKKWFSLPDAYAVDIEKGEDDVLVLAAAIVVDLASHPARRTREASIGDTALL